MKPRSNGFVYHYFLYLLLAKKEIRIQAINICGPLASVIPGFNCTFNESGELVFLNFSDKKTIPVISLEKGSPYFGHTEIVYVGGYITFFQSVLRT